MASKASIEANVNDVTRGMHFATIRIRGMRHFNARLWIARQLICLAALICPGDLRVEDED